jgi:hypothetical protein
MAFTIHLEMPRFQEVDERQDKYVAVDTAQKLSFTNMQEFVLVMDNEKEVIAVFFRGNIFEKKSLKGGE